MERPASLATAAERTYERGILTIPRVPNFQGLGQVPSKVDKGERPPSPRVRKDLGPERKGRGVRERTGRLLPTVERELALPALFPTQVNPEFKLATHRVRETLC